MKQQGENRLMMMVWFALVTTLLVMVSGCATQEKFEKRLDSFVFATESQLVSKIGPPSSVYQQDEDTKILTYTKNGGSSSSVSYYGSDYASVKTRSNSCTVNFFIKGGMVTSYRTEGNMCVSN